MAWIEWEQMNSLVTVLAHVDAAIEKLRILTQVEYA